MYKTIDNSQIVTGTGNIIIICGWTPIERLVKQIDSSLYAAIGNLYSLAGVDYAIRNLLANPYTELYILNATKYDANAGSCDALIDWFITGKTNKVNFHQDIPEWALQELRGLINLTVFTSVKDLVQAIKPTKLVPKPQREFMPPVPNTPQVFPGELYGHRISADTIADCWVKIIHRIRTTGLIRTMTDGLQSQELLDILSVITDETKNFFLPNYLPVDRDFVDNYCQQFLSIESDTYTYGQRLKAHFGTNQIDNAIQVLRHNPNSSRVTLNLWDVATDNQNSTPPCLTNIWLRIINNKLSLTAVFRSHDMFNGYVANAMGLRFLQRHIADSIGVEVDPLIILSESAHLYSHSWDYADKVIKEEYEFKQVPNDPTGNYLIKWDNGLIVGIHQDHSGHYLRQYRGENPEKILRQVVKDNPGIEASHTGYIGIELTKAMFLREEYIQK